MKVVLLFYVMSNTFLKYTIRTFSIITIVPLLQLYNCCFGRGVTPFSEVVILFYIISNTFNTILYNTIQYYIITITITTITITITIPI